MAEVRLKVRLTIEATMYADQRPDGHVCETVSGTVTLRPDGMWEKTISFELRESGEFAVISDGAVLATIPPAVDWCDAPKFTADRELESWLVSIAIYAHRSKSTILRADCEPKLIAYREGLLPLERVNAHTAKTIRTTYVVTPALHSAIHAFFQTPS